MGSDDHAAQAFLVGGGIAALATAVLLIRDAGHPPDHIHIFEGSDVWGGSLDGSGNSAEGYLIRGGRMFEEHFSCTFDLLETIPSLEDCTLSVAAETRAFSRKFVPSSNCRLVRDGWRMEAPRFGLNLLDHMDFIRLLCTSERSLGTRTIEEHFAAHFFATQFWLMWCTMFAFQPWHSAVEMRRYLRRFIHLLPGFNRLEGIIRTRLNQYDSIVVPVVRWLEQQGVHLHLSTPVRAVSFNKHLSAVTALRVGAGVAEHDLEVTGEDRVFVTLGSMTEASSVGSMQRAPPSPVPQVDGAWALWRKLASHRAYFGSPAAFAGPVEKTQWLSFTVTLQDSEFFDHMEVYTGNEMGTGGLVTFADSNWIMSIVLARQPHFDGQPDGVCAFWGYGLRPGQPGNLAGKPMLECSGAEILDELAFHLHLQDQAPRLFESANCIPCLMPFITSQFMPRQAGDRPAVIPRGANNFAFIGQFVEMPEDTVFTVEYSVRSAQAAVYGLFGAGREMTLPYRGYMHPGVLCRALQSLWQNA